jgi:hypothetical protein
MSSQIEYLGWRCSIIVSRENNKVCSFCKTKKNSSLIEKNSTYCGAEYVVPNMGDLLQVSASLLQTIWLATKNIDKL